MDFEINDKTLKESLLSKNTLTLLQLKELSEDPKEIKINIMSLAAKMFESVNTVKYILETLEHFEFIQKKENKKDPNKMIVSITPKGEMVITIVKESLSRMIHEGVLYKDN